MVTTAESRGAARSPPSPPGIYHRSPTGLQQDDSHGAGDDFYADDNADVVSYTNTAIIEDITFISQGTEILDTYSGTFFRSPKEWRMEFDSR